MGLESRHPRSRSLPGAFTHLATDTFADGYFPNSISFHVLFFRRSFTTQTGRIHHNTVDYLHQRRYHSSGGSKGGRQGRAPPPGGQNSFIFMQFSAKKIDSHTHSGSWRPPPGENPGSATA